MNPLTEGQAAALHTVSIRRNHCVSFVWSTCKNSRVKVNAPKNPSSPSRDVLDYRVLFFRVHRPCAYLMCASLSEPFVSRWAQQSSFTAGVQLSQVARDLPTCRGHTLREMSHNTALCCAVFLQRCVASMKQLSQWFQHVSPWPKSVDLAEHGRRENRETD